MKAESQRIKQIDFICQCVCTLIKHGGHQACYTPAAHSILVHQVLLCSHHISPSSVCYYNTHSLPNGIYLLNDDAELKNIL